MPPEGPEDTSTGRILDTVWAIAVQRNPMLLATLRHDYAFGHLKDMIDDCITRGVSVAETIEHAVSELLRTAAARTQPSPTCDHAGASTS